MSEAMSRTSFVAVWLKTPIWQAGNWNNYFSWHLLKKHGPSSFHLLMNLNINEQGEDKERARRGEEQTVLIPFPPAPFTLGHLWYERGCQVAPSNESSCVSDDIHVQYLFNTFSLSLSRSLLNPLNHYRSRSRSVSSVCTRVGVL